ncbi:MAG: MFS transporter [Planctomycetales bacterium]
MSRYAPLLCLALIHLLVDTCANLIEPLWGELRDVYRLGELALFAVLAVQTCSSSFSQAVFGWHRDRFAARYLLWLGPVVAACCMSLVGFASHPAVLCGLLILGGLGIGAFHPEAAVTAGQMLPAERTRATSVFLLGGTLGLGLGPVLSGTVVARFGLAGLAFVGPVIVALAIGLFALGERGVAARPRPESHPPRRSLRDALRGKWGLAAAIWLVCSLRLVPNMAMNKVLAFTLTQHGKSVEFIGWTQALFLLAGGFGMFLMAYRFPAGREKAFMIWCPALGVPLLLALGYPGCPLWLLLALLVPTGLLMWGTTPVMLTFAQRHFPHAAGVAASLTMGLSFGLSGTIGAGLLSVCERYGAPQQAFLAFVPCVLLAVAGAARLPEAEASCETASRIHRDNGPVVAGEGGVHLG